MKNKIQKNIKNIIGKFLVCCLYPILFSYNAFPQEFVKTPDSITVEGVPAIPSFIKARFDKKIMWKANFFLGWSSNSLMAEGNSPFFVKSPLAEQEKFQISLYDREEFELQPKLEKNILFTKDNQGDEVTQLFKYNLESKQTTQLTNPSEVEFVSSFGWSANGDAIYLTNRKQKENLTEIYLLNSENKNLKLLASLKGDTKYIIRVSENHLVFRDYLSNNHVTYYLMDLKTFQIKQLTTETAYVKGAKFSRLNNGIWWLSNKEGKFFNLYFHDLSNQKTVKINKQELNLNDFALAPDEKTIAFKINEYGAEKIRLFKVSGLEIGKEIPGPQVPEGVAGKMQWRNERELGFDFESFKSPSQILSYDIVTNKLQIWVKSEVTQDLVDKVEDAKLIKWKSFDRREITGFIAKPKLFDTNRKLPVIIDIHGGPKSQFQPEFDPYSCYFISELSVAKIFPNIRGSSGFGREFEDLDNKEKRENAVKDLQALLDWIKEQPDLDSEKIFATGSSYGSFMAFALGLKEPNRIKGIVAESPLISIKSDALTSSEKIRETNEPEYGSLKDEKLMEQLEKLSVLNNDLKDWKIPVFLAIGKNDTRVPPEDVRKIHRNLLQLNKESWFLEALNEGHTWSNWNNSRFLYYTEFTFYKKHLF